MKRAHREKLFFRRVCRGPLLGEGEKKLNMHISFDCQDWFGVGGAPGEDVSGSRTQTLVHGRAENTPDSSVLRQRDGDG